MSNIHDSDCESSCTETVFLLSADIFFMSHGSTAPMNILSDVCRLCQFLGISYMLCGR